MTGSSKLAPVIGSVVGVAMISFGIASVLSAADDTKPAELGAWLVGLGVGHDLILVPVVLAVSWVVARFAPPAIRPPLLWGLAASAIFVAFAWPFVAGYGRNPGVPSLLNRDYGRGLAVYLGVVWLVVAAWVLVRVRSGHSSRDSTEPMS